MTLLPVFAIFSILCCCKGAFYLDASSTCGSNCNGSPGSPFSTWSAALNAIINNNGGTLIVADGVYSGPQNKNFTLSSINLTIKSSNTPSNVVIDCEENGFAFYFYSGTYYVSGLTITNCQHSIPDQGGAITTKSSFLILTNININNCRALKGGALYVNSNAVEVYNSSAESNTAQQVGGAIYLVSANLKIYNSKISGNSAVDNSNTNSLFCQSAAVQFYPQLQVNDYTLPNNPNDVPQDKLPLFNLNSCPQCSVVYTDGGPELCSSSNSGRVFVGVVMLLWVVLVGVMI